MCQSEGVCAPFGRGLVNVQFPECTFILDIYNTANNWGICISWRVSVSPLGAGNFGHFGKNLGNSGHSGNFGQIWAILGIWGNYGHSGQFWAFWAILGILCNSGHFGQFLANLAFGQFWAFWEILGILHK